MKRNSVLIRGLLLTIVGALRTGWAQGEQTVEQTENARYQMVSLVDSAVLIDTEIDKSWVLAGSGEKRAWIPIKRIDDAESAAKRLEENAVKNRAAAFDDPALDDVMGADVAIKSLAIELARERAALRRLLREFGSQHPTVIEARERVRQLEQVLDR